MLRCTAELRRIKLVAFDMDGVLVKGESWAMLHRAFRTLEEAKRNKELYSRGELSLAEWARRDAELWEGKRAREAYKAFAAAEPMGGVGDVVQSFRRMGCKLVVISNGFAELATELMRKLGVRFDEVVANRLLVREGRIVGIDQRVDFRGKGEVLESLAARFGLSPEQCIAIGDHENDLSMFRVAGLRVAFNQKSSLLEKEADFVVKGQSLVSILNALR